MPEAKFGPTTTAEEVCQNVDLRGRLAVLTGASAGIGAETARVLASSGADVVLGARRTDRLTTLAQDIERRYAVKAYVHELDLSNQASVDAFAGFVIALSRRLDILCCNAATVTQQRYVDGCGNELQFSVNYLGHALLVSRLSVALAHGGKSRLVCMTSRGHQEGPIDFEDPNFEIRPYNWLLAYRQSKSAMALLAVKAQAAMANRGVTSFAVHPGVIQTELQQTIPAAVQVGAGRAPVADSRECKTVAQGAATAVWAAGYPGLEVFGGSYLEDCNVARPISQVNRTYGVMPHARDPVLANRVWSLAERLLGRHLTL